MGDDRIRDKRKKISSSSSSWSALAPSQNTKQSSFEQPQTENGQAPQVLHDFSRIPISLKSDKSVSQPSDPVEQEAEQVANQVIAMNEATLEPTIQRQAEDSHSKGCGCPVCASKVKLKPPINLSEPLIRRQTETNHETKRQVVSRQPEKNVAQATDVGLSHVDEVLSSSGNPLDQETRSFMEQRFGYDFASVRIHNDDQAGESAQSLQAQAYTVGQDIVFAPGKYTPETTTGKQLLAHELTHVVQQQSVQPMATESMQVEQKATADIHGSWFSDAVDAVGGAVSSAVDTVGGAVGSAVDAVGGAVGSVVDTVGGAVGSAVDTVGGFFSSAWNTATTFLGDTASWALDGLRSLGDEALSWLSGAGATVWNAIKWFGNLAWDGIKELGSFLWEKLSLLGTMAWSFLSNLPIRLWRIVVLGWEGLTGVVGWLWDGLSGAGSWAWDALIGVFSWLGEGLSGAFSWLGEGLSKGAAWAIDFAQDPSLDKLWSGLLGSLSWLGEGVVGLGKWGWDGIVAAALWAWKGLKDLGSWLWDGLVGGLEWAGKMLLLLLEALGLGEVLQIIWGLIFRLRPLTSEEIAASQQVHASGQIPYSIIRVDENSIIAQLSGRFSGMSDPRAVTTMHILHVAPGEDIHTMVHELTHVAQYESAGAVYMAEAIHAQQWGSGYSYNIATLRAEGKHFRDLNREQQAQMCEDYYLALQGNGSVADLQPFIDEMRRGEF